MGRHILGIDIGGTKCAVILGYVSEDGGLRIADKTAIPTKAERGPGEIIDQICGTVDALLAKSDVGAILEGIGVSCGGPLDSGRGVILSPPNLPGWDNVPIVDILKKRYEKRAVLQNDANACALAEWRFGAAKGLRNVIFLTFGTGMGAGLILDGKLYGGANGMAGEAGHMRLAEFGPVGYGKSGSFEGFCSGGGIAQLARIKALEKLQMGERVGFCDMSNLAQLNAKIVGDAAMAGDPLALGIYGICGRYLGKGLSILIDILNPEMIVIGGIYGRCEGLLWPAASEAIEKESLAYSRGVCRIAPAGLGEAIGDYAALAVAVYDGHR